LAFAAWAKKATLTPPRAGAVKLAFQRLTAEVMCQTRTRPLRVESKLDLRNRQEIN
jgi:hypothetical protein